MWAWWLFRQRGYPICPTEAAHEVINAGPYRVSRNPMYFGMLAILTGATLTMGSIPALIAPVGFFLLINNIFIPYEENSMRKLFEQKYGQYEASVRKWL
jgi:protein-S-isoprenylcysteine O-methyltransferase Ste14